MCIRDRNKSVLAFGLVFLVSGLAFKLGVVPFHMWIPDVYHGAPTSVTLLIGSAPKLAAFAITMRLLVNGLIAMAQDWQAMLVILSAVSYTHLDVYKRQDLTAYGKDTI